MSQTNEERLEKAKQIIEAAKLARSVEMDERKRWCVPGALVFDTKAKLRGVLIRHSGPMSVEVLFDGDTIGSIIGEYSLVPGKE